MSSRASPFTTATEICSVFCQLGSTLISLMHLFLWLLRVFFRLYNFPHSQEYSFSLRWVRVCSFNVSRRENDAPQLEEKWSLDLSTWKKWNLNDLTFRKQSFSPLCGFWNEFWDPTSEWTSSRNSRMCSFSTLRNEFLCESSDRL